MKSVLVAGLGFVTGLATGALAAADSLRCHSKEAIEVQDDGSLRRDGMAEYHQKEYQNFIVDITTGAVRFAGEPSSIQWTIVQEGTNENDTVLVPYSSLAGAATDSMRIRQWKHDKPILFMVHRLTSLITGTCEPVQ